MSRPESVVGHGVLAVVTSGLYDDPMAIYREYLQNAADAWIKAGTSSKMATVWIEIDPGAMSIIIRDNGPGLSHEAAKRALIPIGRSDKTAGDARGFRGIGRLVGLAFGDSVTFTTMNRPGGGVTRVVWDGEELRRCLQERSPTGAAVVRSVRVDRTLTGKAEDPFFEVRIDGVHRHVAGVVLNREAVRAYVGEVCPVPLPRAFPFRAEVEELCSRGVTPLAMTVLLAGDDHRIERRLGEVLPLSTRRSAEYRELEEIEIPSLDGRSNAAVGWVAHSSYEGAIRRDAGIRGLRARVGNIQIGGARVFDHLFEEERFNRWTVGELHICDARIVPNARRDYFEPSPHTRNLENHLRATVRGIARRCRGASKERNEERQMLRMLGQIEETCGLVEAGFLREAKRAELEERMMGECARLRERLAASGSMGAFPEARLSQVENKLVEGGLGRGESPFGSEGSEGVAVYQSVCEILIEKLKSPTMVMEAMRAIVDRRTE